MNKPKPLLMIALGVACLWGLPRSVGAADVYHTNRTFTAVAINAQGNPPLVDQLYTEAGKLTELVQGANILIHTNETYAIERQGVALGYASSAEAWAAAVAYNATNTSGEDYTGKIYDNAGWVRGTKSVGGKWGAYLWTLQNRISFQSSATNWWTSPSNGVRVAISNVLVGSLGDYPPMAETNDTGPIIDTNFPGENQGESQAYYALTNVYYQLIVPAIWITPRTAYAAAGGEDVQYTVAGTNITNGVTWTIDPEGVTNGATIQASNDWHFAGVTPGTVLTNYKVRATSVDNTNFYDEVDLIVVKVDIFQTNVQGYVYSTNCVWFCLTTDSWTNAIWSISPDLGTNGAQFTSEQTWTGVGTNTWQGTSVWVYAGPVTNTYTLIAQVVGNTNCFDTATLDVCSPTFVDFNWLEATNEALHHTSLYQTNALVLRRADKFKVEAKLTNGYESADFDVWFQAVQEFDGTPVTNGVPVVAADLGETDWYCKLLSVSNNADQTKTVKMEINIPSTNCPIGEYQWRALVVPKAATNLVLDTTNFPGQVIILFNPWGTNDSVYMVNDADRTEYIIETSGILWRGKRIRITSKPWRYGQYDAVSLGVLLSELSSQDTSKRVNPIYVSRHLSARVNCNGGGILWGLWPKNGVFPSDGKPAEYWSGSDQILTQYQSTGNPVKYGQCWAFGGLLTTMLRSCGIPARPITTYDSAHDTNGNQFIEFRCLANGNIDTNRSEMIWNFHVWCDAWMLRPDQTGQDGWQAVDATPQEQSAGAYQCGPASHVAVKGNLRSDYDSIFVHTEVQADIKVWRDVPGGGEVFVGTLTDRVGHNISTKSVGAASSNDITSCYK